MAKQEKAKEKNRSTLVKRTTSVANSRAKNKKSGKNNDGMFKRMKDYFKGVRLVMKKVVWPTKKELGSYTAVVLAICVSFALAFWAIDSGVLAAIRAICF